MKIQSISDIITNSSTQVFTIVTNDSIESVKRVVNGILELSGCEKRFDDLFIIEPSIDRETALDLYQDEKRTTEIPSDEELKKFAINYNWYNYGSLPLVDGIAVIPKDDSSSLSKEVAKLIEEIPYIFEHESMYC